MVSKNIVVATHGHCFDGMSSAALFTLFMRILHGKNSLKFRYLSCGYSPKMKVIPEKWFTGDENAILDFRYSPSEKLTWYFDHHITAFANEEERIRAISPLSQIQSGKRVFYDPSYGSCTKLIQDLALNQFQVKMGSLSELIEWADKIDTAGFSTVEEANGRTHPIMQLASVVEHHADEEFLTTIVPMLLDRSITEVAQSDFVRNLWEPLSKFYELMVERVRRSTLKYGEVIFADLTEFVMEASIKFVAYSLFPEIRYSVALTRQKNHFKLSVGHNPWCGKERDFDIASICNRYGGGGHPAVGGASFSLSEKEKALEAAKSIVDELNGVKIVS